MQIDLTRDTLPSDCDLVLIIGLSGSGKSTLARQVAQQWGAVVVETDQYFYHGTEYRFDRSKLRDAHRDAQKRARAALKAGQRVIIANTCAQPFERRAYLRMARKPVVHTMNTQYDSIHAPAEAIERQRLNWTPYTPSEIVEAKK